MLITDRQSIYDEHSENEQKILFKDIHIVQASFLTGQEINSLNILFGEIELGALDVMVRQLNLDIANRELPLFDGKFFKNRPENIKAYGNYYFLYTQTFYKKHKFTLFLEALLENLEKYPFPDVRFDLSADYHFAQFMDFNELNAEKNYTLFVSKTKKLQTLKLAVNYLAKSAFYFIHNTFNFTSAKQEPGVKNMLLVIYNIPHHRDFLEHFFELVKARKDIHLDVVIYETAMGKPGEEFMSGGGNRRVFKFKDFKKPCKIPLSKAMKLHRGKFHGFSLPVIFEALNNVELNYAWMDNLVKRLKPSVTFQMSIHEVGRYMADVSYLHQIPSIQVDYALFSDDPMMEKCISFTKRLSVSQAIIDIWKRRNDPSKEFESIGYCKFDNIKPAVHSKDDFFMEHGLNPQNKTVLFASTWGNNEKSYHDERNRIAEVLSGLCAANQWNLLIKKHPLESDEEVNEIIKNNNHPGQKVFSHPELSIFDAIQLSDLVFNQMSSIVLECLYYSRPFAFISLNRNESVGDLGVLKNENFYEVFTTEAELENFSKSILNDERFNREFCERMNERRDYFLYSTDAKASERLLDNLLKSNSLIKIPMSKPDISIIIPTKDRAEMILNCLESILHASENISHEIIVINDSKTEKVALKESWNGRVTAYENPKSGVASARNFGVTKANSDFLLFMDDDMIVSRKNLERILALLKQDPGNCYIPNWTYSPELIAQIEHTDFGKFLIKNELVSLKGWRKGQEWKDNEIFRIYDGASYCLPMSKASFELVGGYNENFPFAGAEDHDFCARLIKNGVKFFIDPTNTVFHDESDRVIMDQWLKRKRRGAQTIRLAAELGYEELRQKYKLRNLFLSLFEPFLFYLCTKQPSLLRKTNTYNRVLHLLTGINIHKGYFIDYAKNKTIKPR